MKAQLLLTLNCTAMLAFGTTLAIRMEMDEVGCLVCVIMIVLAGFTIGLLSTWGCYLERMK